MTDAQRTPKFRIDFEGAISDWYEETITPPELRELLSLPLDLPIQEVDLLENTKRIVADDDAIQLREKMLLLFPLIICPIFVKPLGVFAEVASPAAKPALAEVR